MSLPQIHVGTSGYHYQHWRGNFYPPGLPVKSQFAYYLQHFKTVEINNSFYRLPSLEIFAKWRACTPDDFVFAVKASRFITHLKKLKEPQQSLQNFLTHVEALQQKLGPVLFQLPPASKLDEARLADFLAALPRTHRYTIEFPNPTWYTDRVYALLEQYRVAFCIYELQFHMSPLLVTTDFVYVRLHGPEWKYSGSYPESALQWWAKQCKAWQQEGREVWIYFDNDQNGYAAFNALRLQELVEQDAGQPVVGV